MCLSNCCQQVISSFMLKCHFGFLVYAGGVKLVHRLYLASINKIATLAVSSGPIKSLQSVLLTLMYSVIFNPTSIMLHEYKFHVCSSFTWSLNNDDAFCKATVVEWQTHSVGSHFWYRLKYFNNFQGHCYEC